MEINQLSPRRRALDRATVQGALRASHWLGHHWLVVANSFFGAILLAGVLAPLSLALGFREFSLALYDGLKIVCHQLPERSFFVFGYQMGFCERDTAIFVSVALTGLIYAPFRRWVRPLSWTLMALFAAPMAVDGVTQLFGWRESDAALRSVTGALFGIGWVWLIYPWANLHMILVDRQLHEELDAEGVAVPHHGRERLQNG
ncbi:MAG: DUF2085 domain-containing protein [Chloroflexi bacterium]|nr:DUF2085 domain-containing protein [Chloroflexota bacterium]